MPNCNTCSYFIENKSNTNVRISKGMMKPHKRYCIYKKMKLLSADALGIYGYPIWCPLNKCQKTCMECGTRIRDEEGDYCKKHR